MTTVPTVSFRGVLRSERIKVTTLRSTMWLAGLAVVLSAGFMGLIVFGVAVANDEGDAAIAAATTETFGTTPTLGAIVFAFAIVQVIVALLGTLVVSSERASGLITATVPAVPKRLPIVAAKLLVVAVVSVAIGLATAITAFLIAEPAFSANGHPQSLTDPASVRAIVGGALYIGVAGMLGSNIAFLLRNPLAAAAAAVGLLLVVPSIVQLVPVVGAPIAAALPAALGGRLYSPGAGWSDQLIGLGGLAAWAGITTIIASVSFARRDV